MYFFKKSVIYKSVIIASLSYTIKLGILFVYTQRKLLRVKQENTMVSQSLSKRNGTGT